MNLFVKLNIVVDKQLTEHDFQVTIKNPVKQTFSIHQKFEMVSFRNLFGVTSHFYYFARETFKTHNYPHADSIIVVVRDVFSNISIGRCSN